MCKLMEFKIKQFLELSVSELYQILQLRSEVFVVEQDCVYQDLDFKDQKALHILGFNPETSEDKVIAYTRIFKPGDYFENASIGRVVVKQNERKRSFGHELMRVSIATIKDEFHQEKITISAQFYLKKFYESHGFIQIGETYLEDGIPHIRMDKY